ncbi:MAG: hypothetical protein ACFB12_00310 [Leptolyngbyaceae cyanobacterium]
MVCKFLNPIGYSFQVIATINIAIAATPFSVHPLRASVRDAYCATAVATGAGS